MTNNLARLNFGPAANTGSFVHLKDPMTGELLYTKPKGPEAKGEPVGVHVLGIDSDAFVKAENANRDEVIEETRTGTAYRSSVHDARATRLLMACTTGWQNIPAIWLYDQSAYAHLAGKTDEEIDAWFDLPEHVEPVEFSPALAMKAYGAPGLKWLREQIDAAIGDRSRFLKN